MDSEPKKADDTDLEQLTARLAEVGRLFEAANGQIVEYLVRRDRQRAEPGPALPADLTAHVSQLAARLEQLAMSPPPVPAATPGAAAEQVGELLQPIREKLEILDQQNTALYQTMEQFRSQLDGGVQGLAALLVPQPHDEDPSALHGDWMAAILGPQLAGHGDAGRRLLEGILAGDSSAQGFAGQLLVFRSATPERLPQTLKDLGEAYYRWRPKTAAGNDPFEEALAGHLQRACENAGIHNSIELVHPGQRFDAARHNAGSRGVEIVQVLGWIVLRDNGKVYTKASVEVR
ncbi:MAG: hypothetical protein ACYC6Y_01580 [Thermoguttaceae bacterium]